MRLFLIISTMCKLVHFFTNQGLNKFILIQNFESKYFNLLYIHSSDFSAIFRKIFQIFFGKIDLYVNFRKLNNNYDLPLIFSNLMRNSSKLFKLLHYSVCRIYLTKFDETLRRVCKNQPSKNFSGNSIKNVHNIKTESFFVHTVFFNIK